MSSDAGRAQPEIDDQRPAGQEAAVQRLLSLQRHEESDAGFARRMGIPPQILSNYKNGHHGLSLKTALRVHSAAAISLDWLLTGRGAPTLGPGEGQEEPEGPGAFMSGASFTFDRLIRSLDSLLDALIRAGGLPEPEARRLHEAVGEYLEARRDDLS